MGNNNKGESPEERKRLEKLKALQMVLSPLPAYFPITLLSVQLLTQSLNRPTWAHRVVR
jgi:hypothetical protein